MRATIIGKARNLSISSENSDKRLLGDVSVEGRGIIHEAFEDEGPAGHFQKDVEGFIGIYAQGSEALRRLLVVRNLDKKYQQVIDRYRNLKSLTTFDRDGAKLVVSVMLNANDFNYFASFIEANFFTDLEYIMDVPFYGFPVDTEAQAQVAAKYKYIMPTKLGFQSGKPCFFPNAGVSFIFKHPTPR
jgi:hypothetical protein